VTVNGGATLDLNNFNETIGSLAGAGKVTLGSGTLTAGANNTSTDFSGVISGSGGLNKTGTGALTLSGANTYTGTTTVNEGVLRAGIADSAFGTNRTLYFCFSEPEAGGSGNSTALAKARLSGDATRLEGLQVIFSQKPKFASRAHFGCRIVEARDGTLFYWRPMAFLYNNNWSGPTSTNRPFAPSRAWPSRQNAPVI